MKVLLSSFHLNGHTSGFHDSNVRTMYSCNVDHSLTLGMNEFNTVAVVLFHCKAHSLTAAQIEKMYPKFSEFRQICQKLDPHGTFYNEYLERVIFGSPTQSKDEKPNFSSSKEQRDRQFDTHPVGPGL